ncbi:MAG: alpha/beta fold hydrolase, partial [Chloroflexi bacterium]|nr:alpha/beta fold hydrolase [Chloroflexota bacterium]
MPSSPPATQTLLKGAEPFHFKGGPIGCLLVHGFTASPEEMRGLGEHLAGQGHSVHGVRLAGHGTTIEDMARCRWQDWAASVEAGYRALAETAECIFMVGLSMGGALALLLGPRLGAAGIVGLAVPYTVPDEKYRRHRLIARALAAVRPYRPKSKGRWFNPAAERTRVAYTHNPLPSVIQLDYLLAETRRALPGIHIPVRLVYSRDDTYVTPSHGERLLARLGSPRK